MNNIAGLAVLALGIVLLIFGFNESHSFSSDVSKTFTGNPTNHSMWLIVGGAVAVIAGIGLSLTGRRKS
jgi:LPXTG-motif cell wall-anchored protein